MVSEQYVLQAEQFHLRQNAGIVDQSNRLAGERRQHDVERSGEHLPLQFTADNPTAFASSVRFIASMVRSVNTRKPIPMIFCLVAALRIACFTGLKPKRASVC